MGKKIGIIGAGAMGSVFAWLLKKAGTDPVLYETSDPTLEYLSSGLTVIEKDREYTVDVEHGKEPSLLETCEIIIMFVKSYATNQAMEDIHGVISDDTVILTLQNGLGNVEAIAQYIPKNRIVYGSTTIGGHRLDSGDIVLAGIGNTVMGGGDSARVDSVVEILQGAGLPAEKTGDPEAVIWRKAAINAGINPLGALLSVENGKLLESIHSMELQEHILSEAAEVALGSGIIIAPEEILTATREVCRNTAANRCSMLQDMDRGRPTEIDSINGMFIRHGAELGIPVPYNRTVHALVKAREKLYPF